MEQYQVERAQAIQSMVAMGKDPNEFSFDMSYIPPDPDGAGMFTLMYEIIITHLTTHKSIKLIGGIGWQWVDHLMTALQEGDLD